MVCLPMIALFNVVSGGMISTAIGTALGSQVLGSAVLGLVTSGGNPMGAIMGGLGGAMSSVGGAMAEAAGDAGGGGLGDVLGSGGSGAENIVGSADDFAAQATDGLDNMADSMSGGPVATETDVLDAGTRGLADATTEKLMQAGAETGPEGIDATAQNVTAKVDGVKEVEKVGAQKEPGILEKFGDFTKKNPTLTKMGLGALDAYGKQKQGESLLEYKKRMQLEYDQVTSDRAFKGANYNLNFRPSAGVLERKTAGAK